MGMGIWQYAPNRRISHYTDAAVGWQVIGVTLANVVKGYPTIAALHADASGNLEWPNLDTYTNLQYIGLRSTNGAAADGGAFFVAFDKSVAPSDNDGELISGSGQFALFPGPMHNIWVKKPTAGDHVILLGAF